MSTAAGLLPLQGVLQAYDWGKKGSSSAAAVLHASNTSGSVDEGKPGAELWMGSHPSGPARVVLGNGQTAALSDVIGGEQLVYLLKVLSISSALSIQSHPDKALAEALHKRDPKNYKDSNHKPEMAVAVTAFEAMCGFRPVQEISAFLREFPEFRALVGEGVAADFERTAAAHALDPSTDYRPALRRVFTQAMTPSKEAVTANLTALINRIQAERKETAAAGASASDAKASTTSPVNLDVRELILRLHGQHPNDVGIFAVFLLNCFGCLPGDALVLPANEPHAYLSGDIVECMACSDNVVRAGLTPKFRDTETLCEMLTYNAGKPPVYRGEPLDSVTTLYLPSPPITEFCLARVSLPAATASTRPDRYTLKGVPGYSIILAYTGSGRISAGKDTLDFKRGSIFLLPSGMDIAISASPTEDALLFRCCANLTKS